MLTCCMCVYYYLYINTLQERCVRCIESVCVCVRVLVYIGVCARRLVAVCVALLFLYIRILSLPLSFCLYISIE